LFLACFAISEHPLHPPLDTTVTRICLWVRLKWILRPYLLTAPNSSYHCLMAR